jgi:glucan phosphorylase
MGVCLNVATQLFDVQMKRTHEPKRQALNIFLTVTSRSSREKQTDSVHA